MFKKFKDDTLTYLGFYNIYLIITHFLTYWEFKLIIDFNLLPFFVLLAGLNLDYVEEKRRLEFLKYQENWLNNSVK